MALYFYYYHNYYNYSKNKMLTLITILNFIRILFYFVQLTKKTYYSIIYILILYFCPTTGSIPVAVDVDCAAQKLYWTDIQDRSIHSSNLDGTDSKVIVSSTSEGGFGC